MARKAPLDDYVIETLLPDLVGHDRAPSAFIVFLKIWHASGGAGRRVEVSLSTLAVETGLSKSSIQAAVTCLKRRGLVSVKRGSPTAVPVYTVLAPWRR